MHLDLLFILRYCFIIIQFIRVVIQWRFKRTILLHFLWEFDWLGNFRICWNEIHPNIDFNFIRYFFVIIHRRIRRYIKFRFRRRFIQKYWIYLIEPMKWKELFIWFKKFLGLLLLLLLLMRWRLRLSQWLLLLLLMMFWYRAAA